MVTERVVVLLPCHTLDDFPTWLEEPEANQLLAAWTAAWHPAILAATGAAPGWASVDLAPPAGDVVGVIAPFCDQRFAGQAGSDPGSGGRWVREVEEFGPLVAAIARACGLEPDAAGGLPGDSLAEDFHALGLAVLLAELLARRMRTDADLEATGFAAAAVAAARAAVAGNTDEARDRLREAHACLDATRARYYPVGSWAVDIVLLAPTTLGAALVAELDSPVPVAIVASGSVVHRLAERHPASLAAVREAVAAGRAEACGGRDDERPLDGCLPEEILASFEAGRAAWREHVGAVPVCQAAVSGGGSAFLPHLLAGLGYRAAVWSLFDGSPQPDPGAGRVRWESPGGRGVEALARVPLSAAAARSVLEIPGTLGDALDHDHSAVIQFAAYAGTTSRWHRLVRRIGAAGSLLGTFATPGTIVAGTADGGSLFQPEPDAFAPSEPPPAADDPLGAAVASARACAARIAEAAAALRPLLAAPPPAPAPRSGPEPGRRGWLPRLRRPSRADGPPALENGLVRLEPHPVTGGILSLRRPGDRANRLSQQLALRTTAEPVAGRWEPPEDRASYTRMVADSIGHEPGEGPGAIVSRGRLVDASGGEAGRFRQRMTLARSLPLAILDVEIVLPSPPAGPILEAHVASRFAWHENEDVEIRRSLHGQSVVTERTRFTAPHFVEIVPADGAAGVAILTGGLPWHVRSSPHVLDSVLLAGSATASRRLAVGIGLESPWDAALALLAGAAPEAAGGWSARVRLTPLAVEPHRVLVGLVESAGRSAPVRIDWARDVVRAVARDPGGEPRPDVHVAVEGRSIVVSLPRYQWLVLEVEFPPSGRAP